MGATTTAAALADNALTTLEDTKNMLGIAEDDADPQRDAVIAMLINSASSWVERMTGRTLGKRTYLQQYDAIGAQELVLRQWPILAVEYVLDTQAGAEIPAEEYDINTGGDIGILYNDGGWPLRGHRGGLAYDIITPMRCLEVKYTAGYVLPKDAAEDDPCTLPADLQAVVWGVVMQEFNILQNGAAGLSAFSISDVSWTFDKEPRQGWLDTIGCYTRL